MQRPIRMIVAVAAVLAAVTGAVVVPASSASAEVVSLGLRCEGDQVVRCAWLNVDTTNNRIRAWASIADRTTGDDRVEGWVCMFANGGLHSCGEVKAANNSVTLMGDLSSCSNGISYEAYLLWERGSSSGDHRSAVVRPNVC